MTPFEADKIDTLRYEDFADKTSYHAFLHAVDLATKMKEKMDANKGCILSFDDEIIMNADIELTVNGKDSRIGIRCHGERDNYFYSIFGCVTNDDGLPYARKHEMKMTFKRISIYKKI